MKIFVQFIVLFLISTIVTSAQLKVVPKFSEYEVKNSYQGKTSSVKLVSAETRLYRTMLRQSAKNGVNFAGHFVVATWGCGSDCHSFAIIDARDGKVYFSPTIKFVGGQLYQDEDRVQFKKHSRLLILAGSINDKEVGKFFFEWKNNRLRLLRKIELPIVK